MKIAHQKQDLTNVRSKCGTMANVKHTPGGGDKKVRQQIRGLVLSKVKPVIAKVTGFLPTNTLDARHKTLIHRTEVNSVWDVFVWERM